MDILTGKEVMEIIDKMSDGNRASTIFLINRIYKLEAQNKVLREGLEECTSSVCVCSDDGDPCGCCSAVRTLAKAKSAERPSNDQP